MKEITDEIEKALSAGMYYLAIVTALALPDICAALESSDGQTSGAKYKAWYDFWMARLYTGITALDLYSLRCGIIHQGRLGHPRMQYARIIFTIPNAQKNVFHNNVINDALNLDAIIFCKDVIKCVSDWYTAKQNDPDVQANLQRLLRFRPNGIAPYSVCRSSRKASPI